MSKRCALRSACLLQFVLMLCGAHLSQALAQTDSAAAFPGRTVRIVIGFAAGGGTDIVGRLIAPRMFTESGRPVIVENRTGAGGMIAAEQVAKAAADGYTLLMAPLTTMTVNPAVYPGIRYSPLRDFAPVSFVSSYPYILVVSKSVPVRTIRELIDYAKANPNKANYAGASPIFQLTTVLFRMVTGAPMEYIGYKSTTESVSAVMSGDVLMTMSDAPPLAGPIKGGRVLGLAVTSSARTPSFPDIPTVAELGLPRLEMVSGLGVLAPAGTPAAIVEKLQNELIRIVRSPDIGERFRAMASEPVGSTAEEFRRLIATDLDRWTAAARAGNVKIDQ